MYLTRELSLEYGVAQFDDSLLTLIHDAARKTIEATILTGDNGIGSGGILTPITLSQSETERGALVSAHTVVGFEVSDAVQADAAFRQALAGQSGGSFSLRDIVLTALTPEREAEIFEPPIQDPTPDTTLRMTGSSAVTFHGWSSVDPHLGEFVDPAPDDEPVAPQLPPSPVPEPAPEPVPVEDEPVEVLQS